MNRKVSAKKIISNIIYACGIIIPLITIILFAEFDMAQIWNSWGIQEDGTFVKPDWRYIFLIVFKIVIYFIPALCFGWSHSISNKKNIRVKKFSRYLLQSLNHWFLILLVIKLCADSIFEIDRIFGFTLLNSIKDVQTLIGYIITFILQKKIKIEPDNLPLPSSKSLQSSSSDKSNQVL